MVSLGVVDVSESGVISTKVPFSALRMACNKTNDHYLASRTVY